MNIKRRAQWTAVVVSAVLLFASCGGTNESSGRNRTLNSVVCYQTQAEKDAALADAELALNEAQPPILSEASSAGIGQVAFVGPVQWWKRLPRADTTTTVAAPVTTVAAPVTTVAAPVTTVAATTTTIETTTTVSTEPASRSLNAPTNVQATADGSSVSVSWTAPEATGTNVERYALLWSTNGFQSIASWSVNGTSATVPNFQPGDTVQFQVRADNDTYRVYSGFSAVASATIPGSAAEETTTTTVADPQSSDEESTTSVPLINDVVLAELQAQVDLINETPLCADLDAATTIECAVEAGFNDENSEQASIITCADADEVRVQFDGGFGSGSVFGGDTFLVTVGAVDQYVFQLARAGVVIASGTVQRGAAQSFNGIDQASLVISTNDVESDNMETVECNATAGLDLNQNLAYVNPCADATFVKFTFEGSQETSTVAVTGGQRVSVVNSARVGFAFEVYVGEVIAVSGSVAYPTAPVVIITSETCPVSVTDAGENLEVRGCAAVTRLVQRVERTSGSPFVWNSYVPMNFQKWSEGAAYYHFDFYVGEQLVTTLSVSGGGESVGANGTWQNEVFADVDGEFSGSFDRAAEGDEEQGDGGSGGLEPREGYVICTAFTSLNSASFDCSRPLSAMLFVRHVVNDPNPEWLFGNESTILGPVEPVSDSALRVTSDASGELLLDLMSWMGGLGEPAEHQFYVPDIDVPVFDEFEEDYPYFEGVITPNFPGETTMSFTIPEDYSAEGFFLGFSGSCDAGTFQAVLNFEGQTLAQFYDPGEGYFEEGICGVFLEAQGEMDAQFLGQTFEVVLSSPEGTPREVAIFWDGTVDLQGGGVSSFDDGDEEEEEDMSSVEWSDPVTSAVSAPQAFEIEIPAGGKLFEIRGNSNQFEADVRGEEDCSFVDPYLKLYNSQGELVDSDDDGGEVEGQFLSSRLGGFLSEGTYTLLATTFDIEEAGCPDALTAYELVMRFGTRITSAPDTVVPVPTDATSTTTTSTTVPGTTTTSTTVPSTTTTSTTVPGTTTTSTTVPSATVPDAEPTDNQPVVTPLAELPANLQPDPAPVAVPVKELQRQIPEEVSADDQTSTPPKIGIPAGVNELLCNEECVALLLEQAGVEDGTIEIAVGSQVTEIGTLKRSGTVAVRPGARQIVVTVTPSDGSTPVVLTRDIVVLSPLVVSTKVADTATTFTTKSMEKSNRLPIVLVLVAALVVLAAAGQLLVRRGRGRTSV